MALDYDMYGPLDNVLGGLKVYDTSDAERAESRRLSFATLVDGDEAYKREVDRQTKLYGIAYIIRVAATRWLFVDQDKIIVVRTKGPSDEC